MTLTIAEILEKQRAYFNTGATLPVSFRIKNLLKLYKCIRKHEDEINAALQQDLGKCQFEAFTCETGLVLMELNYMIRHTPAYAMKHPIYTPVGQCIGSGFKKSVPYGNVLIMSPWNYPFLLTMEPISDAIAAGNTIVVKPSAYAPATGDVVETIIKECFPEEYIAVVRGGREENQELLKQKFDMIFFTGSQSVGKEVLRHAAEHITPVVLELGGKSPCVVDSTAKIKTAARRIVYGKFLNCGQTCVVPDYIICHSSVKQKLVEELCKQITVQFGDKPLENPEYGRIVNKKHFDRVVKLIDANKVVCGGEYDSDSLKIAPTVMDNVTWDDAVMQEEIFGPVLPVVTFETYEELYELFANKPKPLGFYIFSEDRRRINQTIERCAFGGGCINDTIMQIAINSFGFGGVGESGMGSYHGKAGFNAFSHEKSIHKKVTWYDFPVRYSPHNKVFKFLSHLYLR
ncbi:MAG: aldehyde dehydrogenase [Clostridia bacterium]|nr:aldehyde dehydrogenase [Clostridia bacterium]